MSHWTAREIAKAIACQAFAGRHLIVLPNTYWPGSETDLLLVRTDLRLVDIEIKISRADLKADAKKSKWFDQPIFDPTTHTVPYTPRSHPRRIWKHYYCVPEKLWKKDLGDCIPPASGVICLRDHPTHPGCWIERQAKAAKNAERITPEELCDIARVQSLKLWSAYDELDRARRKIRQP